MARTGLAGLAALVLAVLMGSMPYVDAAQITSLPGLPEMPPFNMYSGYINVSETKQMFYWFVESQSNPSTDPVVLWMQGGPGCSGLLGFFQEHGPYKIARNHTLIPNPESWNKRANVIYIESPIGVGFSYSPMISDYSSTDNSTAVDNYNFLLGWFSEFPQFQSNQFWITGESYGGVYVPTLTNQIIDGSDETLKSQFTGIMVGNPVIDCEEQFHEELGVQVGLFYFHGLIPLQTLRNWTRFGCFKDETSNDCREIYKNARARIGPLETTNLYYNWCVGNGTLDALESQDGGCDSLEQRNVMYLNRPDVKDALHVQNRPVAWAQCTRGAPFNYTRSYSNMLDYYNKFFTEAPKLKITIYSGDVDIANVPHAITQMCLEALKRPVVREWQRWTMPGATVSPFIFDHAAKSNITCGYVTEYDTYQYVTVKGAGHEVPTFQPTYAYQLFERVVVNGGSPLDG